MKKITTNSLGQTEAILQVKFIALRAKIKTLERIQVHDLMIELKSRK